MFVYIQPLRRSSESSLRKRERRLAQISLLIVLIFIICHSIKNIPSIFEILGKDPRVRHSYLNKIMLSSLSIPDCSSLLTTASGWSSPPHYQQQRQFSFLLSWQLQEGCQDHPEIVREEKKYAWKISIFWPPNNEYSDERDCLLKFQDREERYILENQ